MANVYMSDQWNTEHVLTWLRLFSSISIVKRYLLRITYWFSSVVWMQVVRDRALMSRLDLEDLGSGCDAYGLHPW